MKDAVAGVDRVGDITSDGKGADAVVGENGLAVEIQRAGNAKRGDRRVLAAVAVAGKEVHVNVRHISRDEAAGRVRPARPVVVKVPMDSAVSEPPPVHSPAVKLPMVPPAPPSTLRVSALLID